MGSRLERCFFETVFFLAAVEGADADEDEDEADCCWYANAWTDATRRAAAIAKHLMVRVIERLPALLSRNQVSEQGVENG